MIVSLEHPQQPDIIALIAALDVYQASLYPAESNHFIDIHALARPDVLFAVARIDGLAIGCGAVVMGRDYGEVKRMYVAPGHRGGGVARSLVDLLEAEAKKRGCTSPMLETGIYQPEALALYGRCGYTRRGPFGNYSADPLSVFMQKRLDPESEQR